MRWLKMQISDQDIKDNLKLVTNIKNPIKIPKPLIIGGPCRVESIEQMTSVARMLVKNGIEYMKAGIYKPCTFPYANQGLGYEGLKILEQIKAEFNLKFVTEIMHSYQLIDIGVIDIIQVGARNMQNYNLLVDIARANKPVLLKRHPGSSLRDFLGAAEWIMAQGNDQVILCERGVCMPYTHSPKARWALDISIIPAVKQYTRLPIIIDPSHAAGVREFVPALSKAAIAAGADGLIIETHPEPEKSLSDAVQTIDFKTFEEIANWVRNH
jgi:3-deoxy-7-phosphoheptulonate synthase